MVPSLFQLPPLQAGLLLTTLSLREGDAAQQLLALCGDNLAASLAAPRAALAELQAELPAGKFQQWLLLQLQKRVQSNGHRGLDKLDPGWIVRFLRGESPLVVGAILMSLPASLQRSVVRRLPHGIVRALPTKVELSTISPVLTTQLRLALEQRCSFLPELPPPPYRVAHIVHLERLELVRLIRDLGLVELGQTFAAVGKMALAELARRLTREQASELVAAVSSVSTKDIPDKAHAEYFLREIIGGLASLEEILQTAGLFRLVKASLTEDEAFWQLLLEHLPPHLSPILNDYRTACQAQPELSPTILQHIADSVGVRLALLVKWERIGRTFSASAWAFYDADSAHAAIARALAAHSTAPGPLVDEASAVAADPSD